MIESCFLARYTSCDDVDLHAKLKRDVAARTPANACYVEAIRLNIMQVVALMEVIFPVNFATFSNKNNLMKLMGSDLLQIKVTHTNSHDQFW